MSRLIKITKLSASPDPLFDTPDAENYKFGIVNNNVSIPIDYTVEGHLLTKLEVGKSVIMLRKRRNGVDIDGIFQTSPITEFTEDGFKTLNSIYLLELTK